MVQGFVISPLPSPAAIGALIESEKEVKKRSGFRRNSPHIQIPRETVRKRPPTCSSRSGGCHGERQGVERKGKVRAEP